TELTDLTLTIDPTNPGNGFSLTGLTTVDITDDGTHVTVNDVHNTSVSLNFSLTTTSGDLIIADNGIGGVGFGVGNGTIVLTAQDGAIVDAVLTGVPSIITGGGLALSATDGIAVETDVATVAAQNTGAGGIIIRNA